MKMSPHGAATRVMALALILVLPSVSTKPAAQPRTDTPPTALSALRDPANFSVALDTLVQLGPILRGPTFQVGQQAVALGANVDAAFAFVRDRIGLQIYTGVLRGPRGTLLAQAGNAFDRTLLLGALLKHHGHEVRYVRGRLSEERAAALADRALEWDGPQRSRLNLPPTGLTALADAAAGELVNATGTRWVHNVGALRSALTGKTADLGAAQPDIKNQLTVEARDHLWLEVRRGDRWVALDATVAGARPGETFATPDATLTTLPTSVFHYVTLRYLVEERGPQGLGSREILRQRVAAADLTGVPVSLAYRITSTGGGRSASPVLTVADRTMTGQAVFGSGVAGGAPQLGKRVSGLLARPGQAPAGGQTDVSAHRLEVVFTDPSGRTETVRRTLFDRIGPLARAHGTEREAVLTPLPEEKGLPLYLASVYGISFSTGPLPPGTNLPILARHVTSLRALHPLLGDPRASGRTPTPEEAKKLQALLIPVVPDLLAFVAMSFHVRSTLSLGLFRRARGVQDARFYEASPRLAIASVELPDLGRAVLNLDLRRNDLRVVGRERAPRSRAWANLVRGVLDATVEDVLINAPGRVVPGPSTSAAALLARGQEAGGLVLLRSSRDIAGARPPDAAQGHMLQGLRNGVVLVALPHAVRLGTQERLAWWRIDLGSGETVAVLDSGLHQATAEDLVVGSVLALSVVAAVASDVRLVFYESMRTLPEDIVCILTEGSVGSSCGRSDGDWGSVGDATRG